MDLSKIEIRTQSDLVKLPWFKIGENGMLPTRECRRS
jgi:hypothetical protein